MTVLHISDVQSTNTSSPAPAGSRQHIITISWLVNHPSSHIAFQLVSSSSLSRRHASRQSNRNRQTQCSLILCKRATLCAVVVSRDLCVWVCLNWLLLFTESVSDCIWHICIDCMIDVYEVNKLCLKMADLKCKQITKNQSPLIVSPAIMVFLSVIYVLIVLSPFGYVRAEHHCNHQHPRADEVRTTIFFNFLKYHFSKGDFISISTMV